MTVATLTSKGQVTIPKAVRESLHLRTGDKVNFVVTAGGEAVLKPLTRRVDEVFGRLHRAGRPRVSVTGMHAGLRRRARERFR